VDLPLEALEPVAGFEAMDEVTITDKRRAASLARKTKSGGHNGGRPRSATAPRCPCGAMTAKCALARSHRCEGLKENQ
jgi:hypothetical protein